MMHSEKVYEIRTAAAWHNVGLRLGDKRRALRRRGSMEEVTFV